MNLEIDFIAHNNKLKNWNPKFKIIMPVLFLIVILIANSPLISMTIFFTASILLLAIVKIPLRFYLKFISLPIIFATTNFLFMIFFFGTGEIIYSTGILRLVIRNDALSLGINTFLRVMACFSILSFLSMTTPIYKILNILYYFKIPKVFLEIAMLMYSLIFIFLSQCVSMRNAQSTRLGYNGLKNSYRSLGILISNLFFRSLNQGEKLQIALDSRCFDGDFPVYRK